MEQERKQQLIEQYGQNIADKIEALANHLGDEVADTIDEHGGEEVLDLLEYYGTHYKDHIVTLLEAHATAAQIGQFIEQVIKYTPGVAGINRVDDMNSALDDFASAIDKSYLETQEILARYVEDEKHLEYMADNPCEIILNKAIENTLTKEEWDFALYYDYIDDDDIAHIEDTLGEDREGGPNTSLQNFWIAIGNLEEPSDVPDIGAVGLGSDDGE